MTDTLTEDRPAAIETPAAKTPFHLRGNFAPVDHEVEVFELEVEGAIPQALDGVYLRNGPNPQSGSSVHWFVGDGMLHAVQLAGGRALSYRNKYVHGAGFGEPPSPTRRRNAANTAVLGFAGAIYALVESSPPTEVTPELETVGEQSFGGRLAGRPFTAHPLIDPVTRELHAFGYSPEPPYLTYYHADSEGRLLKVEEISVSGPTMMHAFAMTERSVVFMDLPVVFDHTLVGKTMPFKWSDAYPARVGVMPKGGGNADVVWADVAPGYVFHVMNAYEADEETVVDVCRYDTLWAGPKGPAGFDPSHMHQWRISKDGKTVHERRLSDHVVEFPVTNPRFTGRPYRYGYAMGRGGLDGVAGETLVRFDHETGEIAERRFGPGDVLSEFTFVPASPTSAEGEGWLMGYVYEAARGKSALVILNAENFTGAATATIRLPQRVPQGFHGAWVSNTDPTANSQA